MAGGKAQGGAILVGGGLIRPAARIPKIDHRRIDAATRHSRPTRAIGKQRRWRAVLNHEAKPLSWIGRIKRHISSAPLQNGQKPNDHLKAALHADRHPLVRLDPKPAQMMGQPVRPRVQLPIGKRLILKLDRNRIRRPCRLRLEQLMDALVRRIIRIRRVPFINTLTRSAAGSNGN